MTVGIRTAEKMEITEGLQGGETVVIEGNFALADGTKVEISEEKTRRKGRHEADSNEEYSRATNAKLSEKPTETRPARLQSIARCSGDHRAACAAGLYAAWQLPVAIFPADKFSAHRHHR